MYNQDAKKLLGRMEIFCLFLLSFSLSAQNSPYISKVYEYLPAPGQFTNNLPEYEAGDNAQTMANKAGEYLVGQENGSLVSLGSWGGYIVVGFDHTIQNVAGDYDFKIYGNAFYASSNPNPDASRYGGSCEPGIVMVSRDENHNGLPDDAWYELAGSEYHSAATRKNYQLTYYKPAADKVATPHPANPSLSDTSYIFWKDNQGQSGYVEKNIYHTQNYFPNWIASDSVAFSGTRLADNGVDESGTGSYYVLYAYDWGYADNHPNASDKCRFKIDWAVDAAGNSVALSGIDFIKVYTGVLQMNGWIGECSTEISGITDLHPEMTAITAVSDDQRICLTQTGHQLLLTIAEDAIATVYLPTGQKVAQWSVQAGTQALPFLEKGMYLLHLQTDKQQKTFKFINQ